MFLFNAKKVNYAIIIINKTRLEILIERFNTKEQAKFYIESLGENFDDYILEDKTFKSALERVQVQLAKVIKYKIVQREYLPSYIFTPNNIILVIGQDGLVANTAKYANNIPIIAINPDKSRYDGVLLPFYSQNFIEAVNHVLKGSFKSRTYHFAEALLNDGQRILAFNDIFIGASTHISARYSINFNEKEENHSSSGIIVSTLAGSTGWLSSIFNMTTGINSLFHNSKKKTLKQKRVKVKYSFNEKELFFVVREPFASIASQTDISIGVIRDKKALVLKSQMPFNGVIFSDGIEKDFLHFNSGAVVTIQIAKERATLVLG